MSWAVEEITQSEDVRNGVGAQENVVTSIHANIGEVLRNMVDGASGGVGSTRSSCGHTLSFKKTLTCAKGSWLYVSSLYRYPEEARHDIERA